MPLKVKNDIDWDIKIQENINIHAPIQAFQIPDVIWVRLDDTLYKTLYWSIMPQIFCLFFFKCLFVRMCVCV